MGLSEYANKQDAAAEFARRADVRKYHECLRDYPERLRSALGELEKLRPSLERFLKGKESEFPKNQNFPPALRDQVEALHRDYLQPGRQRLGGAGTAARIQMLLGKINHAKPEDFEFYRVDVLAKLDCEQASSLLSETAWLNELPASVARVEKVINELVERLKDRPYAPNRQATMTAPTPDAEGPVLDKFDSRLA